MRPQVHSHGPGATRSGSFDGSGAANGTSSAGFDASKDAVTRSVWAITSFDSGPVQRALPDLGWQPAASQPRDMQAGPWRCLPELGAALAQPLCEHYDSSSPVLVLAEADALAVLRRC